MGQVALGTKVAQYTLKDNGPLGLDVAIDILALVKRCG